MIQSRSPCELLDASADQIPLVGFFFCTKFWDRRHEMNAWPAKADQKSTFLSRSPPNV